MATEDYFELFGLRRNASVEEIRAAYRKAAKKAHPDQGGSTEAFVRIQRAAEILLAEAEKRGVGVASESDYHAGDRTTSEGDWGDVAEALRVKWGLTFEPTIVYPPQRIGLSPFASTTALNAPAYQWLTRMLGPRGAAWDFHIADGVLRIFFRRPDDARLFKVRFP
jgi:curved DNA-binding protein CbpA